MGTNVTSGSLRGERGEGGKISQTENQLPARMKGTSSLQAGKHQAGQRLDDPWQEVYVGAGVSTQLQAERFPKQRLRQEGPAVRTGLIDEDLPSASCVIRRS